MSRLEVVGATLRHALNVRATTAPEWLPARTTSVWVDRYGLRASEFRLPKSEAGRRAWAGQTGVDGLALLAAARADDAPRAVRDMPALEILRQVWVQNFLVEHGPEDPRVAWRTHDQAPPSGRFTGSRYDAEARYGARSRATKGATVWSGYTRTLVDLTETCDDATSQSRTPALARGTTTVIRSKFAVADCRACPLRAQCTRSRSTRRAITIRPEAQHEALRAGRARDQTADFAAEYARCAGVEGTIAQGVRSSRLRRAPYCGHAKTHLAHLTTAAALNLVHLRRWLANKPKAQTRRSAFAQLPPPPRGLTEPRRIRRQY